MFYRIRFKAGIDEYMFEVKTGFTTVKDIKDVIKKNFGFQNSDIIVFDESGINQMMETDLVQNARTYLVKRTPKASPILWRRSGKRRRMSRRRKELECIQIRAWDENINVQNRAESPRPVYRQSEYFHVDNIICIT